jgi:hypothetical protein
LFAAREFATPGAANSLGANKALVIDAVQPVVTSVNSPTANGSYIETNTIDITVIFDKSITVTGTPQITLETGATDRTVNYSSGSGSDTLTFQYTVQAGDTSSDLDYTNTSALALNSGTLKDSFGNDADLTLASPGAANSLAANKALVIDTTVPAVSSVNSPTAAASYKAGQTIDIVVNFDDIVTVTGTPQLTLETGTTDRDVNYTSGSASTALTFQYTVQAGDTSSDLDYTNTSALALNSGTIQDGSGNNATLTLASPGAANSLGANENFIIDTTAPTVSNVTASTANGSYKAGQTIDITIEFDENITVTGTPELTLETGTTDRTATYSSGSGSQTLTFQYTVQAGDISSDLDYVNTSSLALNGGTLNDSADNAAILTLAAPGAANSLGANKAVIIDTTAPTVVAVDSTTANATYGLAQVINVTIEFDENITVTGTPQLTLETGTTDQAANYSAGSGSQTLTFQYTVQAGDVSADLDYVNTSSLALNGGTLNDAATNAATLTLASPGAANSLGANKALVIDTTAPSVSSVTSTKANSTYGASEVMDITIVFDEVVTVTGTPQLTLETGTTDRTINYSSGSGSDTLTFQYTVQVGDSSSDLDYTSTSALALNSGTIRDSVSNNADLTLASPGAANSLGNNKAIVIDAVQPTVSNVTSTETNGSFGVSSTLDITVVFDKAITVTGTPQLTLETGSTDETVNYSSGSGSQTLTFQYTVQGGNTSSDLDYTSTSALALNSGTLKDSLGNDATLTLASPGSAGSLGANKALVIDGSFPAISNVTASTANGSYKESDTVNILVEFDENVDVSGSPTLQLETGTTDRDATYNSGSGSQTLTFQYTVQAGDTSSDLSYTSTAALSLNAGTIRDAGLNNADLTLVSPGTPGSLSANKALVIDTLSPTVSNVTATNGNGTYGPSSTLNITVEFNENITVTGTPQLTLETGTTDAVVDYSSGSGSQTLTFQYTVAGSHTSADLDYQNTSALALNGGTLQDAVGNNATLTLATPGAANSLGANKALVIDTSAPTVSSVASTKTNGTYGIGEVIDITVEFTENVTVTGTPQLTLETGATDAVVNYSSGSGSQTLTFQYTVASPHTASDLDYQSTGALALNSGTIQDGSANDATLTLASPGAANSLGSNKALVIDTTLATVSNVTSAKSNGSYTTSEVIDITVEFSENVTVTGTPQLTLETGTTDAVVNYSAGSGSQTLTFQYTVGSNQTTSDLDYVATNSLALNSGTIKDVANNDATLTLASPGAANSLGNNKAIAIDTTAPTVSNVTSTKADGTYYLGESIVVTIEFDENVTVTGTPQLTLETGTTDAIINYTGGSTTTTLSFLYTIGSTHASADLDYVTTAALALNSGTINDSTGNAATLTLASPGAANSLGSNKAIVVDSACVASDLEWDPGTHYDFGTLSGDTTYTFTLRNNGANTSNSISQNSLDAGTGSKFSVDTGGDACVGQTLAPAATCTVRILATDIAPTGTSTGNMDYGDGCSNDTQTFEVTR